MNIHESFVFEALFFSACRSFFLACLLGISGQPFKLVALTAEYSNVVGKVVKTRVFNSEFEKTR